MPRITHVEITAKDPERAAEFYREVFGWMIQARRDGVDYWLAHTGNSSEPGIHAGIKTRSHPSSQMIPQIHVESVDSYCAKVKGNGGKVLTAKTAVASTGYLAYCEDTEGNVFCLLEKDQNVS